MSELVTVFESDDRVAISLAKGMLEQAEIPYIVKNEGLQELFGYGRMGTGYNPIVGAIQLQVDREYAEAARGLLNEIRVEATRKGLEERSTGMRAFYRWMAFLILAGTFLSYFRLWPAGAIILLVVGGGWGVLTLYALPLKRYLHKQGYSWVNLAETRWIFLKVGRKAYKIPPAQEVETLPGFKRNAESLIAIAKLVDKYKDKLMKSPR